MKKRKAFLPLIGLGILVSFGIVACGGDNAGGGGGGTPVEPEEKEMVVTAAGNKKTLQIGETVQLSANEKDGGAAVSVVTWRSRAEAVATVDANGLVTAVGAGSATIRASKDGYATASISITVEKAPEKKANYELPFEDADHYNPQGYWGMQQMGMVYDTPVEDNGGATPDSTSLGWLNQGCKETLTFTSDKNVKVGIGIAAAYNAEKNLAETMTLKVNGTAINLTGKVCPGAEDGTSYYDFHNIELGEATLQATNVVELEIIAQQGINIDNFLIYTEEKLNLATVKPAVKPQIEVEPTSVALQVGETQQLTVKADGQALEGATFRVANDGIATVSSTGLVTAVAKGKTTISVEKDGYKKASVDVTVTAVPVANLIQLEAEDGELFAPDPADGNAIRVEEKASASGGKSVGYFQAGSSITIKYTSDKAFTAELTLCAAAAAMNAQYQIADCILSEALEIKWNDVALDLTGKSLPGNSSWNWENWQEVVLGDVNVLAQENVLVIKALAQGPNVDFVTLADKSGAPTPQKTDLTFNEEQAMASWADKTAYYWNDQNWCGSNVTMVEAYEQDGAYHLAYTATGACDYGLQLFYKNGDLTEGKEYTVSAKVKVEKAASIKINIDESAFNDFEAGEEKTLSIDYTEAAGKSSLKLVFKAGDAYPENKIVISDVKWVEKGGEVPPEPPVDNPLDIVKTTEVDLTSALIVEAENGTLGGAAQIESKGNAHGGKSVGYMSEGASISFKLNASAAGKAHLIVVGGSANADWSGWPNVTYFDQPLYENTKITIGNAVVSLAHRGFLGEDGANFTQLDLGEIDFEAGENILKIEALAQSANFDYIALISDLTIEEIDEKPSQAITNVKVEMRNEKPMFIISGTCKNVTADMFTLDFQRYNNGWLKINPTLDVNIENGQYEVAVDLSAITDFVDGGQYIIHFKLTSETGDGNLAQYTGFAGTSVVSGARSYSTIPMNPWGNDLIFLQVDAVA